MIIIPQGAYIRIKSELQRLAEAANAVTSDVRLELTLFSEEGPNSGEIEAVRAFTGAATPSAVLALIAEIDRLKLVNFDYQMGAQAEADAGDEARRDAREMRQRFNYWKQRAKSAEGHLWASDFQAACDAVHKISNYADIATDTLSVRQKAAIAQAVNAVLVSINARRDVRRPADETGAEHA